MKRYVGMYTVRDSPTGLEYGKEYEFEAARGYIHILGGVPPGADRVHGPYTAESFLDYWTNVRHSLACDQETEACMKPTHTALYTGDDRPAVGLKCMSFYRITAIRDSVIIHHEGGESVRIIYAVGEFLANWGQIETYQEHLDGPNAKPVRPLS